MICNFTPTYMYFRNTHQEANTNNFIEAFFIIENLGTRQIQKDFKNFMENRFILVQKNFGIHAEF